jgi:RHS repeat-associated protein
LVTSSGSTVNPFRFVGQLGYYYDPETGNFSIRWRPYGPVIARWLTVDPLGLFTLVANLYQYVGNNPVTGVDPGGLEVFRPMPTFGLHTEIARTVPPLIPPSVTWALSYELVSCPTLASPLGPLVLAAAGAGSLPE